MKRLMVLVVLALTACAGDQLATFDRAGAGVPPPPPNTARIFVYRDLEPYQSLVWVPVSFNGAAVGAVGPGKVFLRDVAPGTYTIEPRSDGLWPEQAKTVTVQAGETVYAKVTSFKTFFTAPRGGGSELSTFVVVLMDPATARREIRPLWYEAKSAMALPLP